METRQQEESQTAMIDSDEYRYVTGPARDTQRGNAEVEI